MKDFLKNKTFIVYGIAIIFLIVNALFVVKENYFFNLLPFLIAIVFLAFLVLDKLLYIVIFLAPLSIPLREIIPSISNDISLPIEPLLFGILLIVIFKLIFEKTIDKKILFHPVSLAISFNIIWLLVTSITSTMPIVSFKYLISRLWYLASFYLLAAHLFKNYKNIYKYFWLYISTFVIVIFYTLYQHSKYGFFDQKAANFVVSPFLPDHTSYAAIIAMLLPFVIGIFSLSRISKQQKVWMAIVLIILAVGMIFSYTRAAWIGIVGAIGIYFIMLFRIKFKIVFGIGILLIGMFFAFQSQILLILEQNNQESSDNFSEQIKSMSNISTDASNLERINRWNSALRMFQDKPIFGFGPATYMFQYAPYQFSYEKTIISTNSGDGGNAHSEYLGPLAESGILGSLSFILIIIITSYTAIKIYSKNNKYEIRLLAMLMFLGLITYYLHGILNNFLDIDKTSALFWGYTAVIVALDVYHNQPIEQSNNNADIH
ncbi:MAG: O-antigen ligase family protein [Bacteroidales bacterium]|nr:O-antigen ligase family protein [Bacteroidales bacterium]